MIVVLAVCVEVLVNVGRDASDGTPAWIRVMHVCWLDTDAETLDAVGAATALSASSALVKTYKAIVSGIEEETKREWWFER